MSGTKYLLDTNAIIYISNGNQELLNLINNADYVAFSIISVLEFLSFSQLTEKDKKVFAEITNEAEIIDLSYQNKRLIDNVRNIRQQYNIKLPDSIVAATALTYQFRLLSNDKVFNKIPTLSVVNFNSFH